MSSSLQRGDPSILYPQGGAIVYLAARLPTLSETFVYRELLGLRARGWVVIGASVHRPHDFPDDPRLQAMAEEALVVYGPATLAALPLALLAHPRLAARAILDAATADHPSFLSRAKHGVQAWMGLAAGWRLRRRGVAAVHAHMANTPATIALYVARALRARFSFTGHAADLFVQRSGLAFKLNEAAFVSCISRWHQGFYADVTPLTEERRPLVRCSVAIPHEVEPETLEVVTVARLVPKKGVDLLIEAFAAVAPPGWSLRILGDGPERPMLEQLVEERRLEGRVRFEGAQPHARCLSAIAAGGLFVLPCRTAGNADRDGIPVVLMEAMAAGRAVIAGDLPTIRELIEDEATGLLAPPDDVEALAARIGRLVDDPALRARLGAAARTFVAAEFGDAVNLDRLTAAFDRVAA